MIQEKQRLIDKAAAKLGKTIQEFHNEAECLGYLLGNCCKAENIIIECKEILEVICSEGVYSKCTGIGLNAKFILDDIDYFLNKEED